MIIKNTPDENKNKSVHVTGERQHSVDIKSMTVMSSGPGIILFKSAHGGVLLYKRLIARLHTKSTTWLTLIIDQ